MKPNVVQRVIAVAGENFDSRGCRVTNPYITARESIELGNYIVALEEENKKLREVLSTSLNSNSGVKPNGKETTSTSYR